jgi:predicted DsbA family dithiol-disulfide isomerase
VSQTVEVIHFADSACPWDYSAEPVRIALEERYAGQLVWRVVQAGLYASGEAMARRGYTPEGMADSYRIFQARYGMPFAMDLRQRLGGTVFAARAVKAAEQQDVPLGERLLRRLRLAWFAEARLMDELAEVMAAGCDIDGLDLGRFEADLESDAVSAALARDMDETRRPDRVAGALGKTIVRPDAPARYSTPTYIMRFRRRSVTVPGFQPLEAYEVALQNLAPELDRRPPRTVAEFLEGRPGDLYSVVEIAAATARSEERIADELEELADTGPIQRTYAGDRDYWSWGQTAPLRCPPLPQLDERLEEILAA